MNIKFKSLLLIASLGGSLLAPLPPASLAATNAPVEKTEVATRLSKTDKLLFSIQEDPIKSLPASDVFVNAQGDISFPVSRGFDDSIVVAAAGRTLGEVKNDIKTRLEATYYKSATVSLTIKSQNVKQGSILFIGNTVRVNTLPLNPNETHTNFEAVTKAGPTEFANLKKVRLSRIDPVTGKRNPFPRPIDLDKIKKGDTTDDIPLQDGDRIEIPEKFLNF